MHAHDNIGGVAVESLVKSLEGMQMMLELMSHLVSDTLREVREAAGLSDVAAPKTPPETETKRRRRR